MRVNVAINGFGRVGRLVLRQALSRSGLEVVAINDVVEASHLAYLFKYDSVHGTYQGDVHAEENHLVIDGRKIRILSEKEPRKLPWKEGNIDLVVESSGHFTSLEGSQGHVDAGAKRVVITAPAKGEVPTFVLGVNEGDYDPRKDRIVSNASCTTNCLAVVVKVLLDHFGIEEGLMSTVHALTASQPSVDGPSKKDWRGGRASAYNVIPSTTGAAESVGRCLPQLKGKLTGIAFRVPVLDVSVVDLTVRLSRETTYEEICQTMKRASEGALRRVLGYTEEEVVSSDFRGSSYSAIFDAGAGLGLNGHFFKLVAWYDNEWGYAARVVDLLEYMGQKG